VWTASSNVGYQALLYGRTLGTPATTHLAGVANATVYDDFLNRLDRPPPGNNDGFVNWQLEHYLVPDRLLSDGRWLYDYLERRLNAARCSDDAINAFVPIADIDRLREAWITEAPKPLAIPFASEVNALLESTSWRITAPLRAIMPPLWALYTFFTRFLARAKPKLAIGLADGKLKDMQRAAASS
jgi:hypothetical protein